MKNQLIVNCPTCNKKVEWSESSKYRPFCCKRCQLIDLGEWAEENHKIAGASLIDELNDFDEFALGDDYDGIDKC